MAVTALALVSCRGAELGPTDAPHPDAPAYQTMAETHNERLDGLSEVSASGVIELHWTDEKGRHFEQGDVDLWIALPHRTALNVSKFGERFFWAGSSGEASWVFDFRGDDTVLYLAHDAEAPAGAGPLPVGPGGLLELCGLARWPALPEGGPPPVGYDPQRNAWVVRVGRARWYVDRDRLLPVRVEVLSSEGLVLQHSRIVLNRYERVKSARSGLSRPEEFPSFVDLFAGDGSGSVTIVARGPTDDVEPRYFDLDWLVSRFRPVRVQDAN